LKAPFSGQTAWCRDLPWEHWYSPDIVVAISKGKPDFGHGEQIFYGEFDGRRRKRALVKIIGE